MLCSSNEQQEHPHEYPEARVMTSFSKVLIAGLIAATSVTAGVAAASIAGSKVAEIAGSNVTVIYKSDVYWPVKGRISVDPCSLHACVEA
jgi:hypothetical protein